VKKSMNIKNTALPLIAALFLIGCSHEPYTEPGNIAESELYRNLPATGNTNLADVPWNALFTDPLLQSLISEALDNNLDLQVALARIKKAEANFQQSGAALFPSLDVNAGATFQATGTDNGTSADKYELYGSAKWEADLWGKLRGTKRASLALLLQSEAYKRAVQTQLIADVATTYYRLLAYDDQLRITEKTVSLRKESVEAIKVLMQSGVVNGSAVVQSQANRYSAEVTIPDLKQNIFETENNLCMLLGRNPGSIIRTALKEQHIDLDLAIGLPAQLLANRPDVQEAEYQLKYAYEMIHVARAYFYPALNITAQGGFSNEDVSELFDASSVFRNLFTGLTQPVFSQKKNKQRLKVAQASQEEYLAAFKKTLLLAGKEVSDSLFNYQNATEKISIREKQITYLEKSVEYTKELLKNSSSTNYSDVLISEIGLLSAQLNGVSDKLQQLQAVVTLYRSLGGGWKE